MGVAQCIYIDGTDLRYRAPNPKAPSWIREVSLYNPKLQGTVHSQLSGFILQVFKVLGKDLQPYALKEVYMKHLDDVIKNAYLNEIRLLKRLRGKPEIITLHD